MVRNCKKKTKSDLIEMASLAKALQNENSSAKKMLLQSRPLAIASFQLCKLVEWSELLTLAPLYVRLIRN